MVSRRGERDLRQKEHDSCENQAPGTREDALEQPFFPVTLPITVGPGCVLIAITPGAHLRRHTVPAGSAASQRLRNRVTSTPNSRPGPDLRNLRGLSG
jgi:small neutral amino acid transporter SnatA (MarC family)